LLLLLCACSGRQNVLDVAADQSAASEGIWRLMLAVCGIMYLLVMGFLAWALWRARRARGEPEAPAAGHTAAERPMERGLAGWSALIVAGLLLLSIASFFADRSLANVGPDPLQVKITANQWWWQVEYPGAIPSESITTANELHLPAGRPARITLLANDVIHSFWVPNLSGKEDLVPGRVNMLTITPRRTGGFRGQCAEFCGLQHAKMALDVTVQDPKDFETWRHQQLTTPPPPTDPLAIAGEQVFLTKACVMCHTVGGTNAGGKTGPDLTHIASRPTIGAGTLPNNRGGLAAWIADPQGIKPGTNMPRVGLTGPELNAVVAYLETLK
jgi:cytochrome c oxidase subunit 2